VIVSPVTRSRTVTSDRRRWPAALEPR
jgi:hypothetical protein